MAVTIDLIDYQDEYGNTYCVGSGNLSAGIIVPQIEDAVGQKVTINIATVGGSFFDALLIYHAIVEHGNVTTINKGYALSAGGLIAMAGKNRLSYPTSLLMMHNASIDPWMMGSMTAQDMQREGEALSKVDTIQVTLLTKYTGVSEEEATAMLNATTYLTGQEAFDKGFFTQLIQLGDVQPMASGSYNHIVAKSKGKFAAFAKDNLKIKDTMSTHTELLDEIKAQREENKGFWATVKEKLGIAAEAEVVPETAQVEPEAQTPDLAAENEQLKAKLAELEANKAETDQVLIEAKGALTEFKAQSQSFKKELESVRSNYKPEAREENSFSNEAATSQVESKFVKPTKNNK